MFYDPLKVSLLIAGYTISGYADGTFIDVEPINSNLYTSQIGINGETNWTETVDQRHKINISLMPSSPSNFILDSISKIPFSFPVLLVNTSDGEYTGGGIDSRILQKPKISFANKIESYKWTIQINDFKGTHIKNKKLNFKPIDFINKLKGAL